MKTELELLLDWYKLDRIACSCICADLSDITNGAQQRGMWTNLIISLRKSSLEVE